MPTPAWDVSLREWGLETLRPGMMLRLSVAGLAVELLIAARTLAPGAPLLPQWPQFLLVPLIFVIHFSSILRAVVGPSSPSLARAGRRGPAGVRSCRGRV